MATSDNKTVSVAQAAYSAQTAQDFSAWLDANPAKGKDKDGKPTETRRVASLSANVNDDVLFAAMHWPALRELATEYRDGDLSYVTKYAVALADAVENGAIKVGKAERQSIIDALVAERKAAEDARADRMRGAASTNSAEVKEAKSKASLLDQLIAQGLVTPEQLAQLGQS